MKKIILLGPKHCGKTSVAKALASLLSCEFIDLDEEITRITGKTPRQLYKEGIDVFQKAEINSLRSLCFSASARGILSVGGGIIDNQEAIGEIKKIDAVKIYLNISADTAWQRISAAGELPPFLQTDNSQGKPCAQETHRALHERRAAAYRQLTDIVINAEGKTPQEISNEIAAEIAKNNYC